MVRAPTPRHVATLLVAGLAGVGSAACFEPPAVTDCKIACTAGAAPCPGDTACVDGYCAASDNGCVGDARPLDASIGGADARPAAFVEVYAGAGYACALTDDGVLWCWGRNTDGELRSPQGPPVEDPIAMPDGTGEIGHWRRVAVGPYHACGVSDAEPSNVLCWGLESGDGEVTGIAGGVRLPGPTPVALGVDPAEVVSIAAGDRHSCAVAGLGDNAELWCWGASTFSQIGLPPDPPQAATPRRVEVDAPVAVFAGPSHNCATNAAMELKCWGQNTYAQLGREVFMPSEPAAELVAGLPSGVTDVALGLDSSCARGTDGMTRCWGAQDVGQLGNGVVDTFSVFTAQPTLVALDGPAAARKCRAGLDASGHILGWGGSDDRCRNAASTDPATPSVIDGSSGQLFRRVAIGGSGTAEFGCAITLDGQQIWCWGDSSFKQASTNTTPRVPMTLRVDLADL